MTKLEFILALNEKLSGLPRNEIEERLRFYTEMIEDRMEEGLTEEQAVSAVGSVDEIAQQIMADIPVATKEKARIERRTWTVLLLVLGSPVWFSLIIVAAAVALSLVVTLGSLIISLWAFFASVGACAIGGVLSGIGLLIAGKRLLGMAMIGAGITCMGLSVLLIIGCKAATKGSLFLVKKITRCIKGWLVKKEEHNA